MVRFGESSAAEYLIVEVPAGRAAGNGRREVLSVVIGFSAFGEVSSLGERRVSMKIRREHGIAPPEVDAKMTALAERIADQYGLKVVSRGHRSITAARTGANATVSWDDESLSLEVELGFLLRPLRGVIERTIREGLDKEIQGEE